MNSIQRSCTPEQLELAALLKQLQEEMAAVKQAVANLKSSAQEKRRGAGRG